MDTPKLYTVNCLTCLWQGKYMLPSGSYYRCQGCGGTGREYVNIKIATARARAIYEVKQKNSAVLLPHNVSENWRNWTD